MQRGFFISFEGVEGSGKSTQVEMLSTYLRGQDMTTCVLREPGGTSLGDEVRRILLDPAFRGMDPLGELLLFSASRSHLVSSVIRPALAQGDVVICDRYIDSSTAYQGYGRGLPLDTLSDINRLATGGLYPDLTILLDVPVEAGMKRVVARRQGLQTPDRFEMERVQFHLKVREGFLLLAEQQPSRIKLLNAEGSPSEVATTVRKLVQDGILRHQGT